jgi:hypothetical protein
VSRRAADPTSPALLSLISAITTGKSAQAGGLWDEWKDRATSERLKSCTMIVTDPNEFAAEIHDRMPVFLTEHQFAAWLSGEAGADYLKPAPNDYLQRWPVSKRVNSSKADADDLTLIEPIRLTRIGASSSRVGQQSVRFTRHLHFSDDLPALSTLQTLVSLTNTSSPAK